MTSTPLLDWRGHDTVAIITFAQTGYPRLTRELLRELQDLLREIQLGGLFRGVVIAANAKSFATGAAIDDVVDSVLHAPLIVVCMAVDHQVHHPGPVGVLGGELDVAVDQPPQHADHLGDDVAKVE